MENLFVPYELAVKLKEKGFDETCSIIYDKSGELRPLLQHDIDRLFVQRNSTLTYNITAPLYQQVIDWFREKHNLYLISAPFNEKVENGNSIDCSWSIFNPLKEELYGNDDRKNYTYYEALKKAIEEAIKLI